MVSATLNDLWYRYLLGGETVTAYGSVQGDNTAEGLEIAKIDASLLPAGKYRVSVSHFVSAASSPTTVDNVELQKDGVAIARIQHQSAVMNSTAYSYQPKIEVILEVDGNQDISVNFAANFGATETQTHNVQIFATKVG